MAEPTIVGYEKLCSGCMKLPPISRLVTSSHTIHDFYNDFLACDCPFCVWLHDVLPPDQAKSGRVSAPVRLSGSVGSKRQSLVVSTSYSTPSGIGKSLAAELRLYSHKGQPSAQVIKGRPINTDPFSQQLCETVQDWAKDCALNHPCCTPSADALLPSYVIEVESENGHESLRLVETKPSQKGQYVALSYVWGVRQQPIMLEMETKVALLEAIPEEDLPQTLKDAVRLTRWLGLRYLWVDALCIVQDNKALKKAEIAKMHQIFGNSYLTIQGANANSIFEGFLRPRDAPAKPDQQLRYNSPSELPADYVYIRKGAITEEEGPTSTRAWCFEESVLPKRLLIYGMQQTIFRCAAMNCTEDGGQSKKMKPGSPSFFDFSPIRLKVPDGSDEAAVLRSSALRIWYETLDKSYTPRVLTSHHDRLLAIGGIAHRLHDRIGGEYLAGIWKTDMLWGLLWRCRRSSREAKPTMARLDGAERAPSWSWAALDGRVEHEYQKRLTPDVAVIAKVLSHPKSRGDEFLGDLENAELVLAGPLKEVSVCQDPARNSKMLTNLPSSATYRKSPGLLCLLPKPSSDRPIGTAQFDLEDHIPAKVFCILLMNDRGLLLERVEGARECYRRVGLFFSIEFAVPKWANKQSRARACII